MDTSDPGISFDEAGVCDYCNNFKFKILPSWQYGKNNDSKLDTLAKKIKKAAKGQPYDCIIGVSGGLDSSYLAYVAKEIMGLHPLLYHVDAGWNTNQAVTNIEKLVHGLNLDLFTDVIDWEEIKRLQIAFLRSQIPDQDAPQDIAFFSSLYKFAKKNNIKCILTGANFSTECCREPEEWGAYPGIDKVLIQDIYSKFGSMPLKTFPIVDILEYRIYYKFILGISVERPLNLLPFLKKDAEQLLYKELGWQKFQHKHHESRFTRFYEDYWMPKKFGFEKRRAHFSSLIITGQMSRDEALERIKSPEMSPHFLRQEFIYIANKLGLNTTELEAIFDGENKTFHHYKNKHSLIKLGSYGLQYFGKEKRLFR